VCWSTEDENTISVMRQKDDTIYDSIRVYMWKISAVTNPFLNVQVSIKSSTLIELRFP
jgi:aspartyl/asparaginyl beta-hydroxylase (cupin superfamily)